MLTAFSLFFMLLGSALGWWIIHELIHPDAAVLFLYGALSVSAAVLYVQGLLSIKAGNRLVPRLLLQGVFYVTMAWAALCLFLPLMFFQDLGGYTKLLFACFVILFFLKNIHVSLRSEKALWSRYGFGVFTNHLDIDNSSVDWEKVARSMDTHRNVRAIGIPHRWHSVISKTMYTFAVAGLYVAGLYSVFAVMTWALPGTVIAGVMLQHASHLFFQAYRVRLWERENGTTLKSAPFRHRKKRTQSSR
ncbi:hypothetical protein [Duganella sp. CF517]|uniref:hypothetical protein n=1 Tax=Duganella sp. CF517 TaxID=1881038 RepID=UPI0011607432|nr:hypothetical protein [Duganella sp. CF517]